MDAVQYLKAYERMCKSFTKNCIGCPLWKHDIDCREPDNIEDTVHLVENWSKKHPMQTNAEKFEQVFGTTFHKCAVDYVNDYGEWANAPYDPKGEHK